MKNVKEFTFAPGFPYMVNSCDKHIHTLPDSSAEVDNILHIYIYMRLCSKAVTIFHSEWGYDTLFTPVRDRLFLKVNFCVGILNMKVLVMKKLFIVIEHLLFYICIDI